MKIVTRLIMPLDIQGLISFPMRTDKSDIYCFILSSDSGLAFIGNNIMGAFNWVSGWLPSFGKSEVVWNDVVVPKLTHLYIPSVYEFIQVQLITRIGSATIHRGCNLQDNLPTPQHLCCVGGTYCPQLSYLGASFDCKASILHYESLYCYDFIAASEL